jgi:hypothetical protein
MFTRLIVLIVVIQTIQSQDEPGIGQFLLLKFYSDF